MAVRDDLLLDAQNRVDELRIRRHALRDALTDRVRALSFPLNLLPATPTAEKDVA